MAASSVFFLIFVTGMVRQYRGRKSALAFRSLSICWPASSPDIHAPLGPDSLLNVDYPKSSILVPRPVHPSGGAKSQTV